MNFEKWQKYSCNNWKGIGLSLYVTGCNFHCPQCHNEALQDPKHGSLWTKEIEDKFIKDCKDTHVKYVCLLGGEPLFYSNVDTILSLAKRLKEEVGKDIIMYSGYTFESLDDKRKEVMKYVNVLVDGVFKIELIDHKRIFGVSTNQRIIDVKKSLEENKVVLYDINNRVD